MSNHTCDIMRRFALLFMVTIGGWMTPSQAWMPRLPSSITRSARTCGAFTSDPILRRPYRPISTARSSSWTGTDPSDLITMMMMMSEGSHQAASTTLAGLASSSLTPITPITAALSSWLVADDAGTLTTTTSYSQASYYTILGLYVISLPGLWSLVQRSTAAKTKVKTYVAPGLGSSTEGKALRQQAAEIMAYMKANNYEVVQAGETITFRGVVQRSLGQAFFLTFCTAVGLISLALVLQIQFQQIELPLGLGTPNWYLLTLLSPYAGIYYWRAGDRVDECTVKLTTNDDETQHEITVQAPEEELERMWRTLAWQEKGMVKIEGILSSSS